MFGSLSPGGFEDPESESSGARRFPEVELGAGDPDVVLLVDADDGTSTHRRPKTRMGMAATRTDNSTDSEAVHDEQIPFLGAS